MKRYRYLTYKQMALLRDAAIRPEGAAVRGCSWLTARSLESHGFGELVGTVRYDARPGRFHVNDAGLAEIAAEDARPRYMSDPTYGDRALAVAAGLTVVRGLAEVTPATILAPTKLDVLARARWAVMLGLAKRGARRKIIARRLNRDVSTVAHGLRRARYLMARDSKFAALAREVDAA